MNSAQVAETLPSGVERGLISPTAAGNRAYGSYVVSPDIHWFETIYGKSLHKRTNQRSNHYVRRGGGSLATPRI